MRFWRSRQRGQPPERYEIVIQPRADGRWEGWVDRGRYEWGRTPVWPKPTWYVGGFDDFPYANPVVRKDRKGLEAILRAKVAELRDIDRARELARASADALLARREIVRP